MTKRILMILVVGMLSACVSGVQPADTYTDRNGKTTIIESDREMCERACNDDYSRCMDSSAAEDNSGINGPSGVFGASGDCRSDLKRCLPTCKGQ
ncbi:MAG: hypothetical protein WCD70_09385 [Alphaproteobacteria bacterium]